MEGNHHTSVNEFPYQLCWKLLYQTVHNQPFHQAHDLNLLSCTQGLKLLLGESFKKLLGRGSSILGAGYRYLNEESFEIKNNLRGLAPVLQGQKGGRTQTESELAIYFCILEVLERWRHLLYLVGFQHPSSGCKSHPCMVVFQAILWLDRNHEIEFVI